MTDELNNKKANPFTVGLIITIGFIGFEVGTLMQKSNGQDNVQQTVQLYQDRIMQMLHEFSLEEVGGLRSDMNVANERMSKDIDEINERLKAIENR